MKVTCEYCESVVDADKNDTCPNCGAPLADSRKAKEAELREAQKKKKPTSARCARSSASSNRSG